MAERDLRHHLRHGAGPPVPAEGRSGLRRTLEFMIGTALAAVFAAIVKFAVLPGLATFTGFSLALGLLPSVDGPIPMFNLAVMRMAMLVVRNV